MIGLRHKYPKLENPALTVEVDVESVKVERIALAFRVVDGKANGHCLISRLGLEVSKKAGSESVVKNVLLQNSNTTHAGQPNSSIQPTAFFYRIPFP